jgi:DNA-binding SARP family transcriptional activator
VEEARGSAREPPVLALQCFGAPAAFLDGRPAPSVVLWRKHLALLVYLALSPDGTRTRAHLLGLLWPEKNEAQARHSLNQAVKLLRHELGDERLISQGESLALLDTGLTVDVLQFEALAIHQPADAPTLLKGDFLEGFILDDAPAFEEWASNQRARLRLRLVATLVAASEAALNGVDYVDALALARRALSLEPYSDPAVRLLMRAAALNGDVAGALATFREFTGRLESQIGEQPSKDLQDLAERVRTIRWKRFAPIKLEEEPPLVGREPLHRDVFGLVEAGVAHGPRTILITGDPGMGRTRLLVECLERWALARTAVAAARPLETDQDVAWSTLRTLLRAGLLKLPGSAGTDPAALALLATLDREAKVDASEVAAALAALLRAEAEEQPVGIAIDDAHLCDGPSLSALRGAVAELRDTPVILLVTSLHDWEHAPPALAQMRSEVGRSLTGAAFKLGPFSEAETRELVDKNSPWCKSEKNRSRVGRRVFRETGGNPFLVVTLVKGLAAAAPLRKQVLTWPAPGGTTEDPFPISVPSLARRALMARLVELDEGSAQVLKAACVGDPAVDVDLLAALTGQPNAAIQEQLGLLERRRFVAFDGDRYMISTPILGEVVRAEWLLPGELHTLRRRAIEFLAKRENLESNVLRVQLLARADPGPGVFDEALAVARAALGAERPGLARRAMVAAKSCLPSGDEVRGHVLKRLEAQLSIGPPNPARGTA